MTLRVVYGNKVLLEQVQIADTFPLRLKGLLGCTEATAGAGLLIRPCCALHTMGMQYAIDVIFMSRNGVVLKTVRSLAPRRWAFARGATQVLELRAGTLINWNIRERVSLRLEHIDE